MFKSDDSLESLKERHQRKFVYQRTGFVQPIFKPSSFKWANMSLKKCMILFIKFRFYFQIIDDEWKYHNSNIQN